MKKKSVKIAFDTAMVVLLPMLMAYSLIGERFHEIAGTLMLALFVAHHILNRQWFKTLFRGRYNAQRVFRTGLNMLLFVFMILQPVSGILMSKHLYTFLPVLPVQAGAREMHMLLAYWGFVLLCVHAGTHLAAPLRRMRKGKAALWIVLGLVSLYGAYAFVKRGLPGYMLGKTAFAFFDLNEPRVFFFADYLAVMVLFAAAGILITLGLQGRSFFRSPDS